MADSRRARDRETDLSDDSSDQFTDASEGRGARRPSVSPARSPIPTTRVERIDDEPAYGEVPGTDAYKKRAQDAVPDEVEVVSRSRSASTVDPKDLPVSRPSSRSPAQLIPKIVAIRIDPDTPAYGEKPGTEAYEKRKADSQPDVILKSPESGKPPPNPLSDRSPTASSSRSTPAHAAHPATVANSIDDSEVDADDSAEEDEEEEEDEDEGFGDDFDEFEEGQEGNDDFGEFDDGFQHEEAAEGSSTIPLPPPLDWSSVTNVDSLRTALQQYIDILFPDAEIASQIQAPPAPQPSLLSDRSLSLYSQLVAPPPLAPPNWLRSRIRRLFLVSLGVPVDLDEILPASKQKKLVLPSINLDRDKSPSSRRSTDSKPGNISKLKAGGNNDSSVSIGSRGGKGKKKAGKPEDQPPDLDIPEATRMGRTTQVRMESMSDRELQEHVDRLEELMRQARAAMAYWENKKEGAVKEKEAFEGVIENLVKHARKFRK